MSDIETRLKNFIVEQLEVSKDQLVPEASFTEDLGADSLDTVELIMGLEEEFDIEISEEKASKILTIQDAIDSIQEALKIES